MLHNCQLPNPDRVDNAFPNGSYYSRKLKLFGPDECTRAVSGHHIHNLKAISLLSAEHPVANYALEPVWPLPLIVVEKEISSYLNSARFQAFDGMRGQESGEG